MKLASLQSSSHPDGVLCVVSRCLEKAILVPDIAKTLQYALDNWHITEPALNEIYQALNSHRLFGSFNLDLTKLASPLPRAYQWADGSAYVNHVELVRKARGAILPENFWTDPLIYQGGSDGFLNPKGPIWAVSEAHGIDFEAEVAVIVDNVPIGIKATEASQHIKLLMLVNDVSLRNLIPEELAKGFGFFQSKPATTFSPVAVTPDELGEHWDGARLHLPLRSTLNGTLFGQPNAGIDMTFSFPDLIAHAAKTRSLGAGSIIGSGTVSNVDRSKGSSCIAEKRMLEILAQGEAITPFMQFGDTIHIDMLNDDKHSIFGAIEQKVTKITLRTSDEAL